MYAIQVILFHGKRMRGKCKHETSITFPTVWNGKKSLAEWNLIMIPLGINTKEIEKGYNRKQ
jgi:hypothetical protein